MTFDNRQENLASSEAFYPSGSFMFCHPSQVKHWQQSVPFGETSFPPTPPDSNSDCCSSDFYQDMSPGVWDQMSPQEEWSTGPSMDHSTFLQAFEEDWQTNGVPLSSQPWDASAWLSATQRSVDLGLSPVLSHESQNVHSLTSLSEPDGCVLPPTLDLSFTAEPSWNGPLIYSSPDVATQPRPDYGVSFSSDHSGVSVPCTSAGLVGLCQDSFPVFFPQGGQAAYPRRTVSLAHTAPARPLRPRSEATAVLSQPAYGSQRQLRPQTTRSRHSLPTENRVSNAAGVPQDVPVYIAPVNATRVPAYNMANRTGVSLPAIADPTAEDFSAFIRMEQEDQVAPAHVVASTARLMPGYRLQPVDTSNVPVDVKPVLSKLEQEPEESRPELSIKAEYMSSSSEGDEGRHRTHPYYLASQAADGLYHCPFKLRGDPNCPHKPTKLKCNYDKFIDSHLKPFRCHKESCSKAEFSSTACLLRHEREAHGMHGHGDKPHLCYYQGCERGVPGNGFPRRYNLFDHMKRVHDHKEDAVDANGSPILGGETQKKIRSKRKASGSLTPEQASQRQRTLSLPQQSAQAVPAPQNGYYHNVGYGQTVRYPGWAANGTH